MTKLFGAQAPGWIDRTIIAATSHLPDNWLGLRSAIGLRRIVTMRMTDDRGFDVLRWGLRLRLHPLRNGCEKGALFTPQMYEAPERVQLFAEIDKAKAAGRAFVFLDIGANVGLFSFLVASYAGSSADILAVEPESENLKRLRFNIAANPGVPIRVVPVALGETAGKVALEIDQRDKGGTHMRDLIADDHSGGVIVECRTLLDVLKQEQIRTIDALKIDVEGAEDKILLPFFRDADKSLWPNFILIEDASKLWRSDLFSFLEKEGYVIVARTKLNVIMRR
jgi:FkbM family methyltransferase